mmetsp:Transcript_13257/g.11351  ORF Transcript_13257/g.11351 Transcript_13257/m.11351 type:complete len:96 (-) Transcript_13257:59-346(-)
MMPKKADIYSAGILLFVLIFGRLPFSEEDKSLYSMFKKDKEKFFEYHTKNLGYDFKVSEAFIELFSSMVELRVTARPDIKEIRQNAWCKKPIYSH